MALYYVADDLIIRGDRVYSEEELFHRWSARARGALSLVGIVRVVIRVLARGRGGASPRVLRRLRWCRRRGSRHRRGPRSRCSASPPGAALSSARRPVAVPGRASWGAVSVCAGSDSSGALAHSSSGLYASVCIDVSISAAVSWGTRSRASRAESTPDPARVDDVQVVVAGCPRRVRPAGRRHRRRCPAGASNRRGPSHRANSSSRAGARAPPGRCRVPGRLERAYAERARRPAASGAAESQERSRAGSPTESPCHPTSPTTSGPRSGSSSNRNEVAWTPPG